jgi:hypothetical protein
MLQIFRLSLLALGLLRAFCPSSFATEDEQSVPVITSADTIEVEFGKPFEYVITATKEPVGFFAGDLPVWVKRKGATLYGNAVRPGDHTLIIRALNRAGHSAPRSLKISVMPREDSTD